MESIRSYRVFDSQNLRFRKKNETKRIIGSKNKVVFDQSGTFYILIGTVDPWHPSPSNTRATLCSPSTTIVGPSSAAAAAGTRQPEAGPPLGGLGLLL